MARYIGPVCRLCRRENQKLYLKGERCYGPKCAVGEEKKRNFPPGQHGQARRPKIVGYGLQLREKQKTKRYFGLGESQFRTVFEKASKSKGITGEVMLQMLERRLDSIVYRIGYATSRAFARQLVRHGHIRVNGKKVNIPSFLVKAGDEVSVREKSRENSAILAAREATAHLPSPTWLDVDGQNLTARILSLPKREELVQINVNEQLIVELYSK